MTRIELGTHNALIDRAPKEKPCKTKPTLMGLRSNQLFYGILRMIEIKKSPTADTRTCDVCGTTEGVKMCPVATGVPFSAPPEQQRYVCDHCLYVWYECGHTTAEAIRRERNAADGRDPMIVPIGRLPEQAKPVASGEGK